MLPFETSKGSKSEQFIIMECHTMVEYSKWPQNENQKLLLTHHVSFFNNSKNENNMHLKVYQEHKQRLLCFWIGQYKTHFAWIITISANDNNNILGFTCELPYSIFQTHPKQPCLHVLWSLKFEHLNSIESD